MTLGKKIRSIFNLKNKPARAISAETGIPKSTAHYHKQKINRRIQESGTDFWETEEGDGFHYTPGGGNNLYVCHQSR